MKKKTVSILFYVMAVFYVLLMLELFFRFELIGSRDGQMGGSYNLLPFHSISGYLFNSADVSRTVVIDNLLGNIVIFIPYGIYLQVLKKDKRFRISLLFVICTSVLIECIQFAFRLGMADIDDVILNSVGGIVGILAYKGLMKAVDDEEKGKTIVTVLSLLVGIPVLFLVIAVLVCTVCNS